MGRSTLPAKEMQDVFVAMLLSINDKYAATRAQPPLKAL
jgi:hypothetical protein